MDSLSACSVPMALFFNDEFLHRIQFNSLR